MEIMFFFVCFENCGDKDFVFVGLRIMQYLYFLDMLESFVGFYFNFIFYILIFSVGMVLFVKYFVE